MVFSGLLLLWLLVLEFMGTQVKETADQAPESCNK